MLQAAGYPEKKGSLERVSDHLGVPRSTLSGWANGKHNPPPSELRLEKKEDLQQFIIRELSCIFGEMDDARKDASYRDLSTAAGILIDKIQLLTGGPTGRDDHTVRFIWEEANRRHSPE